MPPHASSLVGSLQVVPDYEAFSYYLSAYRLTLVLRGRLFAVMLHTTMNHPTNDLMKTYQITPQKRQIICAILLIDLCNLLDPSSLQEYYFFFSSQVGGLYTNPLCYFDLAAVKLFEVPLIKTSSFVLKNCYYQKNYQKKQNTKIYKNSTQLNTTDPASPPLIPSPPTPPLLTTHKPPHTAPPNYSPYAPRPSAPDHSTPQPTSSASPQSPISSLHPTSRLQDT